MLPTMPAIPPRPTTVPTAHRGNMSDTIVYTLADHPWCAAAASATIATAVHKPVTREANTIGTTASAHASIALFRAALTLQPRAMSADDNQPPPMLPASATR